MNVQTMAQNAYATESVSRTTRSVEYEIVARVTHRMKDAAEAGAPGFPRLAEALHENLQVWTVLAADVADPDNGLPRDLRARILYLARFTIQHTPKVLAGREGLAPLLEINTAILRGLRQGTAA